MKTVLRALAAMAIGLSAIAVGGTPVEATHNVCSPHDQGDDLRLWPLNPGGAICRNFVVDSGYGNLMDRQGLVARTSLYTSSQARFRRNFLWYSFERSVTVSDPNVKWASCANEPGYGSQCSSANLIADYYAAPHAAGRGYVLRAYNYPASVTFSAFEYEGMWIAKSCGNWKDAPERPTPIPYITGVKFRDDNRNGVRDPGEQLLSGWQIKVTRTSSLVGQSGGSWTVQTDASGRYRFDLDDQGPGRYVVEEVVPAGWKNYTPIAQAVNVEFGGGDREYTVDFGNAETVADVAKTDMTVVDPPDHIDANVPTDVTVSVTVENLGPAAQVPVADELTAILPPDCTALEPRRRFTALLRRDEPVTREFTFTITCRAPSEHVFEFDDVLSITNPDITDVNPHNNEASTSFISPVHAYTDLGTTAVLTCAEQTDVDVAADCGVDITVSNSGFGNAEVPVDATVAVELALPPDCTSDPGLVTLGYAGLVDGDVVTKTQDFSVVCTHRSFHEIEVSVAVTADDPHVFDIDPSNDTAGDGPSIMEVFHDATMEVTDVHLTCDEVLGETTFTCTADLEYVKTGPAPFVAVRLWAEIDEPAGCVATPSTEQEHRFLLDGDTLGTYSFVWTMTCEPSEALHSTCVVADINPDASEPHAVDLPQLADDCWVVPYCLPTVNPHGQQEPQAPGSGMNEDGFYVFGLLGGTPDDGVSIRDDGSGYVFGPFSDGTRIKWVEANGADPTLTEMGGNNGNGKGQALAVDYRIRAQGDAQAFFVDEKGVEVSVTCLVPPFPK